ncbi:hypothetical protein AXK60_08750 [Tsukamurella pseudospumae]|uniref:Uncharacterized protein n=1 Tax=Tsukamurella pseudospumae TaxID=239498 RepID=A0A138AE27_9ACTN|nr:hypothetical protein AXK61_14170 [Tsukamurella pseudospumae]KXP08751.1 hypothetical protein AXK60_08750 [Tsukamurella pseudospumae]
MLMVTALAGCATEVPGTASAPSSAVRLDTGNYATTVRTVPERSAARGAVMEGRRLADTMPLTTDIDPSLRFGGQLFAGALRDYNIGGSLEASFGVQVANAMDKRGPGYYVRVDTSRSTSDLKTMFFGAWEMDSAAAAAAAVADPKILASASTDGGIPRVPVTIPGYPAAVSYSQTVGKDVAINSLVASGRYVLASYAKIPAGAAAIGRFYDRQIAALKTFTPTPTEKLADLPVDKDGIASRTLVPEKTEYFVTDGWTTPKLFAADSDRVEDTRKALDAAGVDLVGLGSDAVLRARDEATARTLRDELADIVQPMESGVQATEVPGAPGVICRIESSAMPRGSNVKTHCFLAVGRYTAVLTADQTGDAKQQAAAQYLILRKAG